MKRAAFIDRDGTINEDPGYLADPEALHLLPGAARAIRLLNQAGVLAVVVTNQSGVARGLLTEDLLAAMHLRLRDLLAEMGARLDDVRYCPHLPEGVVARYARACPCRKPEPGMILDAAARHGVDLARSVMIGDSPADVEAGRRAGCRTVLIRKSGDSMPRKKGSGTLTSQSPTPFSPGSADGATQPMLSPDFPAATAGADHVAEDLLAAVRWYLALEG